MDRKANKAQQDAINAREPLITVSAGAGTGKTWTLSSRYISLLKQGVALDDILTLTFTEKAAQEMRERIEGMMGADGELEDAVSRFDEAYISTLHSFALRTLRESGLSLDIDPASNIITPPQTDEFRALFARELDENEFPEFGEILSEFSPEKIAALAGDCEDVHAAMGRTPDDFLAMCGDGEMKKILASLSEAVALCVREAWDAWHNVLNGVRGQILKKSSAKEPSAYVITFANFIKKWDGVQFSDENASIFFAELFERILSNMYWGGTFPGEIAYFLGERAKDWRDERKHLLQISKNLDLDKLKENCAQELAEREALMRVCALGWEKFEDMRRRGALLSFTDLIRFAAGTEGSKKFAQIMIDEFQDTDPLQEKMARSFAGAGGSSVFVVGDPKQSIYRFRNADLSIFDRYTAESKKCGNFYVNMDQSFRMRNSLYEHVNRLFGHIWSQNLGRKFPHLKYECLVGTENKSRETETVPAWRAILGDTLENIEESRAALLEKLTDTLKNFKKLTIWDESAQEARPLEWCDCAILTYSRTSWGLIEEIFSGAGVPLVIESGTSWFSHGEVSDLINMLRALADPKDTLANEGWERSVFALSDQAENELREIAQIKGASGVIAYFIDNLGWLKNLRATRRNRALANVRHAARLVGEYERSIYKSLPGCAEWLALALKNDKKFEEPRISSEENAVRLLTVHSSKGLEFPLVVVFGTEATPRRNSRESLIVSKHLGVVSSKHEVLKSFHYALENEATVEEWQRLFYVATTRAKDCVIFCGIKDAEKSAPRDSWLEYLEKAGELDVL